MIPGGYLTIGLGIALAASLLGNAALTSQYLDVRDERTTAISDRDSARRDARQCSDDTARLEKLAADRETEAATARTEANAAVLAAQRRAQQLLAKRPSVPADDCRSAAVQMDEWLTNRKPK